jgi:hypothetical protein
MLRTASIVLAKACVMLAEAEGMLVKACVMLERASIMLVKARVLLVEAPIMLLEHAILRVSALVLRLEGHFERTAERSEPSNTETISVTRHSRAAASRRTAVATSLPGRRLGHHRQPATT